MEYQDVAVQRLYKTAQSYDRIGTITSPLTLHLNSAQAFRPERAARMAEGQGMAGAVATNSPVP